MPDDASAKPTLPIAAAVMAVGTAGFLFYHASATKRREKEAYRRDKLSMKQQELNLKREQHELLKEVNK